MKMKLSLLALTMCLTIITKAQTVDEVLANYFENTGGLDKWKSLTGVRFTAKVNQQGMEIPLDIVQLKDGKQMTSISFQGKVIKQEVFDGSDLWSHNFMTMKAEKSDAETTDNFKTEIGEFPDPFLTYKERGLTVELMGKESVDGTECFKIKLTKKPIKVDGVETDNISYYFFDTENFVPLMIEEEIKSGQMKGMVGQTKFSDYQEVSNGLLFPFTMSQGLKGGQSQNLVITSIEVNPTVDASEFTYPTE